MRRWMALNESNYGTSFNYSVGGQWVIIHCLCFKWAPVSTLDSYALRNTKRIFPAFLFLTLPSSHILYHGSSFLIFFFYLYWSHFLITTSSKRKRSNVSRNHLLHLFVTLATKETCNSANFIWKPLVFRPFLFFSRSPSTECYSTNYSHNYFLTHEVLCKFTMYTHLQHFPSGKTPRDTKAFFNFLF